MTKKNLNNIRYVLICVIFSQLNYVFFVLHVVFWCLYLLFYSFMNIYIINNCKNKIIVSNWINFFEKLKTIYFFNKHIISFFAVAGSCNINRRQIRVLYYKRKACHYPQKFFEFGYNPLTIPNRMDCLARLGNIFNTLIA